jgi:hypothetical protein
MDEISPAKGFINYDERINAIISFLNVSRPAAIFIYHRKRRGFPNRKTNDTNFLRWSLQLQNSLVKADECLGWDWSNLQFGEENQTLLNYGINIDQQPDKETLKCVTDQCQNFTKGEWECVKNTKKEKYRRRKALIFMGFLPKPHRKN